MDLGHMNIYHKSMLAMRPEACSHSFQFLNTWLAEAMVKANEMLLVLKCLFTLKNNATFFQSCRGR